MTQAERGAPADSVDPGRSSEAPGELPPIPNFLVIGAQKSATRWLRLNLGEHPDIHVADLELSYFNRPWVQDVWGLDWYRRQFDQWQGETFIGEATPGYMMWRHDPAEVARCIHQTNPDMRLIALLRNPVDRAKSAVVHHVRHQRLPKDTDLLRHVLETDPEQDRLGIVAGGWYGASLAPYVELFGDALLVLLHDEVVADPVSVYRRAAAHIGADPTFTPVELADVRFSNQAASDTESPAETKPEKPAMARGTRAAIADRFAEDMALLTSLTGLDLSPWQVDPDEPRAQLAPPVSDVHRRFRSAIQAVEASAPDRPNASPGASSTSETALLRRLQPVARRLRASAARSELGRDGTAAGGEEMSAQAPTCLADTVAEIEELIEHAIDLEGMVPDASAPGASVSRRELAELCVIIALDATAQNTAGGHTATSNPPLGHNSAAPEKHRGAVATRLRIGPALTEAGLTDGDVRLSVRQLDRLRSRNVGNLLGDSGIDHS